MLPNVEVCHYSKSKIMAATILWTKSKSASQERLQVCELNMSYSEIKSQLQIQHRRVNSLKMVLLNTSSSHRTTCLTLVNDVSHDV